MDYFRILNMKREPFPNSPDPEVFYPSHNHLLCLQQVEMAVRLRRGLNVVLGAVGTGKTTLCRKLIQQLSSAEEQKKIDVHLILDPAVATPFEALSLMAGLFGLSFPGNAPTNWQMKEAIKNHLFVKGVDEDRIVVLLIDEGQKLPDFFVEILREFLNYETNDRKLLQVVIFAQTEFKKTLLDHANFANRINLCRRLEPFGFIGTCRMIRYRIAESGRPAMDPFLFTYPGMYAVYRITGGYPRSINTLCHHVILELIIQNRVMAGRALVHKCAKQLTSVGTVRPAWKLAGAAVATLLGLLLLVMGLNRFSMTGPVAKESSLHSGVSAPVPAVKAPPPKAHMRQRERLLLGQVRIRKEGSLQLVVKNIYASADHALISKFISANPQIKNIDRIKAGEVINVPAVPSWILMSRVCWLQIASTKSLEESYELLETHAGKSRAVILFPYKNKREGLVFSLLLKERFPDRKSAMDVLKHLSPSTVRNAKVIDAWDKDTVFFRRLLDEV